MDGPAVSLLRRSSPGADAVATPTEPPTLTVEAAFRLSENGRKASLLTGGNGRAEQSLDVAVPGNRFHLITVDVEGHARLKLRPRYETQPDGRIVKIDAPPMYDRPPTLEELFLAAAKNHELEAAFQRQRRRRTRDGETQRELRAQLARAFLSAPDQRALVHPPPSSQRCYLMLEHRRILFDAQRDEPPARDVPAEAHRRFRADERATREHNLQEHANRLALHENKKRFVADWIAAHGTHDQQARQLAGLLPMSEVIEGIADAAFSPLGDWPRYIRNGAEVLQAHLRRASQYSDVVIARGDLVVLDRDATEATSEQWARMLEARAALPDSTVTLRAHRLSWKVDPQAPSLIVYGLLVTRSMGPFMVRREFSMTTQSVHGQAEEKPLPGSG